MADTINAPINHGEPHILAVALVVDTSMMGKPIDELNKVLQEFEQALQEYPLALDRTDITIISFNSTVQTEMAFCPAYAYQAPKLAAGGITGITVLNEAIDTALDALEERKKLYKDNGLTYYRPWLFVLTDGEASDIEREDSTKARLRNYIEQKKVIFIPMGIGERANTAKLQEYYPENMKTKIVYSADAKNFKESFAWLWDGFSMSYESDPDVTNKVSLPPVPASIIVEI